MAKTICNRYFAHSAMPLIQNLDPKTASNIQARNLLLFFLGSKLLRPFWCNMYLSRWGGNHYMFFFTLPLFICIDLCYLNLFLIFRIEVASTLVLMDVSLRCNRDWLPKFATRLNMIIGCSSKSIWLTTLLFCQNGSPMRRSFWQKNSFITHILFELQPIIIFSPVANFGNQSIFKWS